MKNISISRNIVIALAIGAFVLALAAFAPLYAQTADASTHATSTHATSTKDKKVVDIACVQTALDTRETSIANAFAAYTGSTTAALAARKTALHNAWGITIAKDRNAAIKTAWSTWKKAHQDAIKHLRDSRKATWDTFKKTVKNTCKTQLPKEENLGIDAIGSLSL